MKILHVCLGYNSFMNGNQKHMKALSENLIKKGDDVTVYTSNAPTTKYLVKKPNAPQSIVLDEQINGVKVKRFAINYKLHSLLFKKIPRLWGGYHLSKLILNDAYHTLSQGPFIPKIIIEILKFKPDIVMVINAFGTLPYFCYLAKKVIKFPMVLIPCLHIGQAWVENEMIYKIMRSSELIIALTEYKKNFLLSKGIDNKKIRVIGCGVDSDIMINRGLSNFKNKYKMDNKKIILFVGRKEKGKGLNTIIDAMEIVWKAFPDTILLIAGSQPTKEPDQFVTDRISKLEYDARRKIIIVEDFPESIKSEIFEACDIFVMPSNSDSFGIVYLEAWLHAKPVIACRNTAQASFIDDGKEGLLVDYGDKDNLAESINRLLSDDNFRKLLGDNGREKALKNYTWDIITDMVKREYYRLVN